MVIPDSELRVEFMRGRGPGGQHKNKTDSACRITHIPTGVTAYCDERSQAQSKKQAMQDLVRKLRAAKMAAHLDSKKARRDEAIKPTMHVRTYDFKRNVVTDHRTGKTASIKDVLRKGQIDKLR